MYPLGLGSSMIMRVRKPRDGHYVSPESLQAFVTASQLTTQHEAEGQTRLKREVPSSMLHLLSVTMTSLDAKAFTVQSRMAHWPTTSEIILSC